MATNKSENEETETETNKTKVSDSGYSNSCSNSQSHRSNSSKSRRSTSSGSSCYCGHPSSSGNEIHKKKNKGSGTMAENEDSKAPTTVDTSFTPPNPASNPTAKKTTPACIDPALLDNMLSPTVESEALQVGVLAQTLFCIHSKTDDQILDDPEMLSPSSPPTKEAQNNEMILSDFKDDIKHEKEFCIVVSLSDGTVVCTSPSLTNVLGYPKDMWIGRSLINFLHPKDRIAFASHITSAMAHSHFKQKDIGTNNSTEKKDNSDYFYCWIRLYNGLKISGFNVKDKKAVYLPCQLSMNFKEVPDQGVFLVATAYLVKSAFKVPGEKKTNPPTFTIRHTANTLISHVDNGVVPHFGYLPHHMLGRSVFDFYYAEDLPYLKDVYTNVVMEEGLLFMSRPYKFRCQNGDFVIVETEWSSFINPWGKKLEFIIGKHKVLTGPINPDVVSPNLEADVSNDNEDELIEKKIFQAEIKALLTEPIVRCFEPSKQQLAQLVESLEKISTSQLKDQPIELSVPVPSATSEMLGEISPHHVYSDSKSSETPSYTQLTYNENIHRFFASEPKTTGSDESQAKNDRNLSSSSGGEEGKSTPNNSSFLSNSDSCLNGSSGFSSNSARVDRSKPVDNSLRDYNTRPLTEEMLYQHNENMNKQMAQNHKKEKNKGQINRKHKTIRHKTADEIDQANKETHGMKRSVSNSWEGEPMKAFKGRHMEQLTESCHLRLQPAPLNITPGVWARPPFSVPVTVAQPVQSIPGHMSYSSPIMQLPCVYMNPLPPAMNPQTPAVSAVPSGDHLSHLPAPRPSEHPGPPLGPHIPPPLHLPLAPPYGTQPAVQYMPSLLYQLPLVPMVYTQSHIVSAAIKPRMTYMPDTPVPSSLAQQQSSSGATSVKGEPGSVLCSFASASLNQGLSDSSKKGNKSPASSPAYSPEGFISNTGKTKTGTCDNELTNDDTSYCSYSSLFPKTEKSDDSMKDSVEKETCRQYKAWREPAESETSLSLRTVRKKPSWMENVDVTPDLMLRYQMEGCILSQVLQTDLEALIKLQQPEMVNEQLDQLYVDLEGLSKQLTLEESFPSSCSSSDEKHHTASIPSTSASAPTKMKKKKKFMGHDKCAMFFEEDAPLPPTSSELLAIQSF